MISRMVSMLAPINRPIAPPISPGKTAHRLTYNNVTTSNIQSCDMSSVN